MDPSDSFTGDDFGERANTELTEPEPSLSDFASFTGDDFGERANTELTEPEPSWSDFATALAAMSASAAQSPPIPSHGGCDDGFFGNVFNVEAQQEQYPLQPWLNLFCYDPDQHRGFEQAVTATNEHCINGQADSGVSGIHCRNTRSGGAEGVNSSQQVSSDSFNHRKDELDRFRKQNQQEHSSINHKSSQGASCSMWLEATGDEDEIQSTSDAKIDGEELESILGLPSMGMTFCSEKAAYDFYSNYAKKAGFRVRRGKADYLGSDKSVIKSKCFLCSCQGYKSKEQIEKPTRYKRQDTRTGCEAMIKCMVNDGTWTISRVVLEHNHDLKGCLTGVQGRVEGSHATTSLSTGKIADEVTTAGERAFVSNVNQSDQPRTIITDVSEEIANALMVVLPDTRHCLSAWSILNSFNKFLSPLPDQPGLDDLFGECVLHVRSQEEFESKWNSFIAKSKLHEDTWLASLYRTREEMVSRVHKKRVLCRPTLD
ncbi:hypothetical protein NL676_030667 [Syzygium grande]|nr:hypothetical protein NL676_030667 [Syzygium grande]